MSFLPASRTKRNLFKIASLGLAGLIAGLLSGCNDSPNATASTSYTHVASDSVPSDPSGSIQSSSLPSSIEATQIPALRHPPSARRLQSGSIRTVSQVMAASGRSHS
jgi:hypothetical protein